MNNGTELGPHVRLKPIDVSDLEFWQNLTAEPEARMYQPLKQRTADELQRHLGRYSEADLASTAQREYRWVVIAEDSGTRVGVISFARLDLVHRIGRIGYTISKRFWGKGFGTAAVRVLVNKIFTESDTERIEAECSVHNPASIRVLEKNGFTHEGTKRGYLEIRGERVDHHSYGLLRSDWQQWKEPQSTLLL